MRTDPDPPGRRAPTLDEFRTTTETEIREAIRRAIDRALTGPPEPPPPPRRRPANLTGYLPGLDGPRRHP